MAILINAATEIFVSARDSGDALGLICEVRNKHPINLVDHSLTT